MAARVAYNEMDLVIFLDPNRDEDGLVGFTLSGLIVIPIMFLCDKPCYSRDLLIAYTVNFAWRELVHP